MSKRLRDGVLAPGESVAGDARCANCDAVLLGPWCHQCGQQAHDPFKRLRGAMREALESAFHFDARLINTLIPLLLRPGFLTREYLAGRRVRYVAPLRLMFFLAIIAFFAIRLSVDHGPVPRVHTGVTRTFAQARDAAAVLRVRTQLDAGLQRTLRQPGLPGWSRKLALDQQRQIDRAARARLVQLGVASPRLPAPSSVATPPVRIASRVAAPHGWLLRHVDAGVRGGVSSPDAARQLLGSFLHLLPLTMLVLMPFFALLLKMFFPRHLYMEHLLVALHSHAFVFLDLTVLVVLGWIASSSGVPGPLAAVIGWAVTLGGWWIPVYLLLMQKRIYGQRWPGALLAFFGIGTVYTMVLSVFMLVAVIVAAMGMGSA